MAAAVSTQGLGGRKRRDDIWVYFKYNPADNKTECIVKEDGDKCGHKVGGKNTTNLKRHLKARHKDIFLYIFNTQSLDQKCAVGWKPYMSKTIPLLLLLFVKIADLQAYNVLNL